MFKSLSSINIILELTGLLRKYTHILGFEMSQAISTSINQRHVHGTAVGVNNGSVNVTYRIQCKHQSRSYLKFLQNCLPT